MMLKFMGITLVLSSIADGIGSWKQYRKQKVLEMKNGKLISLHWANKLELWLKNKKLPKGKIKYIKQSWFEHLPRFYRAISGTFFGITLITIGSVIQL